MAGGPATSAPGGDPVPGRSGPLPGLRAAGAGPAPRPASDALGAAGSQVGPYAKALAVWLHYRLGLSFGRCAELLGQLGIDVTAGAQRQAAQKTGTDLVPVHASLAERLNSSEVVVMDETGWRVGGQGAWLWVATNEAVTVYNVADGRGVCPGLWAGGRGLHRHHRP